MRSRSTQSKVNQKQEILFRGHKMGVKEQKTYFRPGFILSIITGLILASFISGCETVPTELCPPINIERSDWVCNHADAICVNENRDSTDLYYPCDNSVK